MPLLYRIIVSGELHITVDYVNICHGLCLVEKASISKREISCITSRELYLLTKSLGESGKLYKSIVIFGAGANAAGWNTGLQTGRSRVRFPMVWSECFIDSPSGRSMKLGSIRPLTEMSTKNIYCWRVGKCGRCLGLTTLPPSCVDCVEIWEPQPPGTLRTPPGL